jgi:hypothetical protein
MTMKKPALAFRKPPTAPSAAPPHPDAFVFPTSPQGLKDSGAEGPAVEAKRKTVTREDGRELRRIALYFPVDVARRLAAHCATEDIDISSFVASLVRARLVYVPLTGQPIGLGTASR